MIMVRKNYDMILLFWSTTHTYEIFKWSNFSTWLNKMGITTATIGKFGKFKKKVKELI